ncbi:MAG: APC family permease [Actinomycetota bacterium]
MAVAGEAPALFLRKATGLVKGWSRFDSFLYSFMSVNFVTLGLFYGLSVLGFVPGGQVLPALLISGVFCTFLVITYAGLISVMPRAGGDYVWQSRVLGGGIGFVLAVTGWWFILWYWTPIYGNILLAEVLQPLAYILGLSGLGEFFGTQAGLFTVILLTVVLAGWLVSLGMEGYAKIQKYCFFVGMGGLAIMFLVMLFGSNAGFIDAFNSESARMFGTSGDVYAATIAQAGDYVPGPLGLSNLFGIDTLKLIPFLTFWILYPNWGATLYGEVRGASDFKRVMSGMMWGLWVTIAIAIVFLLLSAKFFGWEFFNAAGTNYWFQFYGADPPQVPVFAYAPMFVAMFLKNTIVQLLLILMFGAWFLGWAGTLFLSSTRVIFAAAFDRVLPDKVAEVSEKRHVPVWALLLMFVPSVVVGYLYVYTANFATYILDAVLVIAMTFFGTSIAAAVLPWRKKTLYANSAIARYKVLGIPLITVSGTLTAAFLGFNLFQWFTDANYAVNNRESLYFMGSMYALALVVYVAARVVRRSQGIDLKAVYQEIPVE